MPTCTRARVSPSTCFTEPAGNGYDPGFARRLSFQINRAISLNMSLQIHSKSVFRPARLRLISMPSSKISRVIPRGTGRSTRFPSNFQIRMILSRQSRSYFSRLEHCQATLSRVYILRTRTHVAVTMEMYTCAIAHVRVHARNAHSRPAYPSICSFT